MLVGHEKCLTCLGSISELLVACHDMCTVVCLCSMLVGLRCDLCGFVEWVRVGVATVPAKC